MVINKNNSTGFSSDFHMFGRSEPQCSTVWTSVLPQLLQQKSSLQLYVDFKTSRVSVWLPGATAGASCKGWMFLLANSSIINGKYQSFSAQNFVVECFLQSHEITI